MKNKTTKKILSLILTACLMLGMMYGMNITANATVGEEFTDNDLKFKVSSEDVTIGTVMLIANNPIYTGTSYIIPATVVEGGITYTVTEIDELAFSGCTDLMSITVPASVTKIGDSAFFGCTNLVAIDVEDSNESYLSEDGVLFNKDKTTLMLYPSQKIGNSYIIPATVTQVDSYSFQNCVNLTSITFLIDLPPIINADTFTGTGVLTVNVPIGMRSEYSDALDGKLPNGSTIAEIAIINLSDLSNLPNDVTTEPGTGDYAGHMLVKINVQGKYAVFGSASNHILYDAEGSEFILRSAALAGIYMTGISVTITGTNEIGALGVKANSNICTFYGTGILNITGNVYANINNAGSGSILIHGNVGTADNACDVTNTGTGKTIIYGNILGTGTFENSIKVTFDPQVGSDVPPVYLSNTAIGSKIEAPTTPTNGMETFAGWYKEAACINDWNFSSDTITVNITLYAKWTNLTPTSVIWSGLTANGAANTIDTTELIFNFNVNPTSLAASDINITGATKGELTGTDLTRKLTISNITVEEGANITVTIGNPVGFTIYPSSKSIAVHKLLRGEQAPLTISEPGAKIYGDPAFNLATEGGTTSGAVSYSITSAGDVISISGNTVTILKTGTALITATMAGNEAYNPVTSAPITITVSQKYVTAVAAAENKTYDGSNSATLSSLTLTGVITGDSAAVTASYYSAVFADANVGNGKAVTVEGISLIGSKAGNYILSSTTAFATANITKADQAVPALSFTITDTADAFPKTVNITQVTGAEYKINNGEWGSLNNTLTSNISENVTLSIRMKGTENYNESLAATVTINTGYENQTAPDAFTLIDVLNADNSTYSVTIPIITNAEYSFDGVHYSAVNTKVDCEPGSTVTGYVRFPEAPGLNASSVTSSSVILQKLKAITPTASPDALTFTNAVDITLSTATIGAVIHYTMNGDTPTATSAAYTEPIPLSATTTIKAIAVKTGMIDSDVLSVTYTKHGDSFTVTFNKNGGDTEANPTTKTVSSGATVDSLPIAPRKSSYTFTGWNTAQNGTGTRFTEATPVTANITVYAQWSYNGGGGGGGWSSGGGSSIPIVPILYVKAGDISSTTTTVTVNSTNGSTKLSASQMDALIKENLTKDIIIKGNGYTISFAKGTMENFSKIYDFGIDFNEGIYYDKIKTLVGNTFVLQVHFNYSGKLPAEAKITFNVGKANAGKYLIYYYYNDVADKLKFMQDTVVDKDGNVTVKQTDCSDYVLLTKEPEKEVLVGLPFNDIEYHWAKEYIVIVAENGLFSGVGDGKFSPDYMMTRGMFVTALGKYAKVEEDSIKSSRFTDVATASYYSFYVEWAAELGIVSGVGDNKFAPDDPITREQLAFMFMTFANKTGIDLKEGTGNAMLFPDHNKISPWANKSIYDFKKLGVIVGRTDGNFDPQGTATRGEIAAMIVLFIDMVVK